MKSNLLQMTQDILSSLNGDDVNSISDTTESMQVAKCIRTTYFNMMAKYDLPENNQLFQLTASGQANQPTLMYKPSGIGLIEWLKYYDSNPSDTTALQTDQFGAYRHDLNLDLTTSGASGNFTTTSSTSITIGNGTQTFAVPSGLTISAGSGVIASSGVNSMIGTVVSYTSTSLVLNIVKTTGSGTYNSWVISSDSGIFGPGYQLVQMVPIDEFIDYTNKFQLADDNVESMTLTYTNQNTGLQQSFTFNYKTDSQPRCCAVLSNYYVIFDSYDSTQDTTLQTSKTMVWGWVTPDFSLTDTFIPALDDNMFPLLYNESKSLAFFELKQMPHAKAEQEVKRQLSSLQKFKAVSNKPTYFQQFADFGRHGSGRIVYAR